MRDNMRQVECYCSIAHSRIFTHKYFKYLNVTDKIPTLELVALTSECSYFLPATILHLFLNIHTYIQYHQDNWLIPKKSVRMPEDPVLFLTLNTNYKQHIQHYPKIY